MPMIKVIIFRVLWVLIYVVKDQVLATFGKGLQGSQVEQQPLIEKTTLRLFRHKKAKRRVSPSS
jgi:hypothetical protein